MARLLLGVVCALLVAGCGSGSSTATGSSGPVNSSAGTGSTTTAAQAGSGGQLVVTGSLSVSVSETSTSANACRAGSGGTVSAILEFDTYSLQSGVPTGTTHFPSTPSPGAVAFFNNNDSTQEWSIGTARSAAEPGTVTLSTDGKSGSADVDMLPDRPNPIPRCTPST